jgi:hypothetical protein
MAVVAHPDRVPNMTDGLFAPSRRALTIGLLVTITLVASESLASARSSASSSSGA